MASAFIGLGSNLGNRRCWLEQARIALEKTPGIALDRSSPLYESAPVGGPAGQGPYLNAVLALSVSLEPRRLLSVCQDIEDHLGRIRAEVWGSRTIDLDLLLYEDLVIDEPELMIPHPRLHQRNFVLRPLADLGPEILHPLLGRTASELAVGPFPDQQLRLVASHW